VPQFDTQRSHFRSASTARPHRPSAFGRHKVNHRRHNHSFAGVVRTPNHDAFGLAVTIFHLLFFGRHPFAGRFQGKGDTPIERAITEYRFAYSQSAAARHILPPPHTLPLTAVSFGLASLFERAFAQGSERGGRPTATQWRTALEMYANKPRACPVSRMHWY
jgi:DNA-binding helix-hairpin-helix protein with protein kinase domain